MDYFSFYQADAVDDDMTMIETVDVGDVTIIRVVNPSEPNGPRVQGLGRFTYHEEEIGHRERGDSQGLRAMSKTQIHQPVWM